MDSTSIKVTVSFEHSFWVAVFERQDKKNYSAARHVFGAEPSDPELYDFISQHYYLLQFTAPLQNINLIVKRKNPKRIKREVREEMRKTTSQKGTLSQEALRVELEKNKALRQRKSSAQKRAELERKFQLKQEKKKQKQRGH